MPSSHGGGGSSSGGGYHSSGTSHSSNQGISNTYYPGARRYHYINSYGTHCYFYSNTVPRKASLGSFLLVPVLFILFPLLVSIFLVYNAIPHKLDSKYCTPKTETIFDTAEVIDNESNLEIVLNEFYEKTGVQPYVFTEFKDDLINEGYQYSATGLENKAFDLYINLFGDDEGHWLIYYVKQDSLSDNYKWCDMAGDNTNCVVTNKLFNIFQDSFQENMNNNDVETSFINSFNLVTEKSLSKETIDTASFLPLIFLGIFVIIGILSLFASLKQYKQLKEYNDYKENKNNGKDDVEDYSEEMFGKKDKFKEEKSEDYIR